MRNDAILFNTKSKYSRGWMLLLFTKNKEPEIVDFVVIDSAYHKYIKE